MKPIDSPTPLLPEILSLHGKWKGSKQAVICDGQSLSWSELVSRANGVANGLVSLGLKKGDRVVVLMSNGIPMLEVLLGVMHAGCVSVPINLSVNDEAALAMIADAKPGAVVTTGDQSARLEGKESQGIVYISTVQPSSDWLDYDAWLQAQSTELPEVGLQADDLLNIIYSSGTTGLPKGIAHSHRGRRDWA